MLDRGSATAIAAEIRAAIRTETGLTASAGVSYNKFLAKLASDHRKPDGLFVITPKMGPPFVEDLPMSKFHGVGPLTAAKMNRLGIHTGRDLRAQSLESSSDIRQASGVLLRRGTWQGLAAGRGGPGVQVRGGGEHLCPRPDAVGRGRPGAGASVRQDVGGLWSRRARRTNGDGEGQIRRFRQITRSRSSVHPVASREELERISLELLRPCFPPPRGIRLLGVTISNLTANAPETRPLLDFMLDTAAEAFDAGLAPDHVA